MKLKRYWKITCSREKDLLLPNKQNSWLLQRNGESSGDFLERLKEAARYCEFGNLKTIADHDTVTVYYWITKLRTQINCVGTVQFVNKQNEPNETVSFARNGQLRKKRTGNGKISTDIHNKAKECPKCGTKHEPKSSPAFGKSCSNCKKPNHFAKVCRVKKQTSHFVGKEANIEENSGSTSDYSYFIGHTDYIKNGTMEKIKVNGKEKPMMKDTGAPLTLISRELWKQTETYDMHKMKYLGAFFSTVLHNNKQVNVNIVVVDADRNFGLLGRDIIKNSKESIDRCFKAEASEQLPTVKGVKASIKLKHDAKPMLCAARKEPLPLERKVSKTIDELMLLGILKPFEAGGVDNCSPVVWLKKGDKLRMCADYKVHVNNKNSTEAYPLPCIETFFSKVSGAKLLAKIDLSNAYWQIPLDEKSQYVCTVNTTRGIFRVIQLPPGLKSAAAIFSKLSKKCSKDWMVASYIKTISCCSV